ncbi:hypothetical protein EDC04DRAFT_2832901 [Pisolithus marmoratus]|nr:hypothetical protein EDC04DRAFT_2832901 [Pisolithus marmoratus]
MQTVFQRASKELAIRSLVRYFRDCSSSGRAYCTNPYLLAAHGKQEYCNPIVNRHDNPEEKMNDEIRKQINESHRFGNFADHLSKNAIKWHVDGHDYMWALSELLDSARDVIFIMDWWLTPELYLRRPPAKYPYWRLDKVLQRKAQQGVKIYVIVYKEVTQTMSMSSKHTKAALEALHPNIAFMHYPDHIGSKDTAEFWSHHEKRTPITHSHHLIQLE